MSRPKRRDLNPTSFAARLAEACGTSEPTKIQQLLNISYQGAKNYLEGRLPRTEVLLAIARATPYSIHWLLTGQGNRFALQKDQKNTPVSTGRSGKKVRKTSVEVINDKNGSKTVPGEANIVVLPSDKILSEAPINEAADVEKQTS